jgi:SagB-type dehydrogenase family enzyme
MIAAGIKLLIRDGASVEISGLSDGVREALGELHGDGISEGDLVDAVMGKEGAAGLPLLYFNLHDLAQQRLLSYRVMSDHGPLATAAGVSSLLECLQRPFDASRPYAVSRFALVRRDGERMVIETAHSSVQITIHDSRALAFLAQRDTSSGLSPNEISALGCLLLACGILVEDDEQDGPLAFWEFHNLLFHARSRIGRHVGSYGGTYPHRDRVEPLLANKPAMSEEDFELFKPDIEHLLRFDSPFTEVLERRKSTRAFDDRPINRRQLGEFLYRAARQRGEINESGPQQLSSRPYPGGGALYELEIYVSVGSCDGLPRGFYHYHTREHRLFKLPAADDQVETLLVDAAHSSGSNPQVLLTITARFGRIYWKYASMGYAAILKNVGVLYQTMYLVAESMGLGACALGGGHSNLLSDAAGLDYYAESTVGEFLIGNRAREEDL